MSLKITTKVAEVAYRFELSTVPLPVQPAPTMVKKKVPVILAYKVVQTGLSGDKTWEGLCFKNKLPTFETPNPLCVTEAHQSKIQWQLHTDTFIAQMATHGWCGETGNYEQWENDSLPFTAINSGDETLRLLGVAGDAHMLFDANLEALPCAVPVTGYMSWRLDNEHYDLDKVFPLLEGRPDVHNLRREPIPYYNREKYCSETLDFIWRPDVGTYRRVWAECLKGNARFPSTYFPYAAYEMDLFGIASAAKPPRDPDAHDDEEDDDDCLCF